MTDEKRIEIFEKMPVKRAVIRQIVPAAASQMITLVYSLADAIFVGMTNDPKQTAAIMVVSSPFVLLTALSNLFGIGGASAVSRALGKKDIVSARQIAAISAYLGMLCGAAFSLLFWLAASPILKLCGGGEIMDFAYGYAKWVIIIGGPFSITGSIFANLIRAEGNSLIAFAGISAGGILNIALDPFFVLPTFLGLGALGAGMATAISNFAAALFFVVYVAVKRHGVSNFDVRNLKYIKRHILSVLRSGFPSALQYTLTMIGVATHTRFTSRYGAEAIAALGIVKKLDQLPLYFSIGVSTGLLPLLAYNSAAGNDLRRKRAFFFGCAISFSFATFCLILYEAAAQPLTSLFIGDRTTVNYASSFLRRMVTAMPMMSICHPMIIHFQAVGKVKESIICSLLRKGLVDIPLYFLMDAVAPLYGLMWVQPISDALSLTVAVAFYIRLKRPPSSTE